MTLESVSIDSMGERTWEWVILSKHTFSDRFIFRNDELDELCGGVFSSSDIEILVVFGRVIRFFLERRINRLFVNLVFNSKYAIQAFVQDIRSRQSKVIIFLNAPLPPS